MKGIIPALMLRCRPRRWPSRTAPLSEGCYEAEGRARGCRDAGGSRSHARVERRDPPVQNDY